MLKVILWLVAIVVYSAVLVGNAEPIKESIQEAAYEVNTPAVTDALDSLGLLPASTAPLEDNTYEDKYNSSPQT